MELINPHVAKCSYEMKVYFYMVHAGANCAPVESDRAEYELWSREVDREVARSGYGLSNIGEDCLKLIAERRECFMPHGGKLEAHDWPDDLLRMVRHLMNIPEMTLSERGLAVKFAIAGSTSYLSTSEVHLFHP
jgi:hypothetical protein